MAVQKKPDLLQYPCAFPLKVIGHVTDDFENWVVEVVRRHAPHSPQVTLRSRPSQGGRYLAVTATFTAESREQLEALYLELSQSERVIMTL